MTKKDFELIAQSIANVRNNYINAMGSMPDGTNSYINSLNDASIELARQCGWDNPRFNKPKFLSACGVK